MRTDAYFIVRGVIDDRPVHAAWIGARDLVGDPELLARAQQRIDAGQTDLPAGTDLAVACAQDVWLAIQVLAGSVDELVSAVFDAER